MVMYILFTIVMALLGLAVAALAAERRYSAELAEELKSSERELRKARRQAGRAERDFKRSAEGAVRGAYEEGYFAGFGDGESFAEDVAKEAEAFKTANKFFVSAVRAELAPRRAELVIEAARAVGEFVDGSDEAAAYYDWVVAQSQVAEAPPEGY